MHLPRVTLKLRVVLSVVLVLAVSLSVVVALIDNRTRSMAGDSALRYSEEMSGNSAATAQTSITTAVGVARSLERTLVAMRATGASRAQADAVQEQLVEANPDFLGVWSGWEPNAFDGQDAAHAGAPGHDATGRYVPYWHRDGSAVSVTPLVDYDTSGAGDYYQIAFRSGQEKVLEPYEYEIGGQAVLMTSVTVPIRVDGEVVGVAGVDLPLAALQEQVAALTPYGTGRATLVSSAGAVVGSGAGAEPGSTLPASDAELVRESVAAGEVVSRTATVDGRDVVEVAAPVVVGSTDTWVLLVVIPAATVLAEADALRDLTVVLALAALLVAALAAFVVARGVVRPIEVLRDRMAEIADGDGDLTQRIDEDRDDEAGQLGAAFNRFVAKVGDTIRAISSSTTSLTQASADLSSVAATLQDGAARTSAQASNVSSTTEQVNGGIQALATGAEEMSASIGEIATNAARSAGVAAEAVAAAADANARIARLGEASAAVGGVVKMITSIAEQTNLLALNATIEAARAGEMGKGFAVVAGEVKELAQQTARATEDITGRIGAIQSGTEGAAETVDRIQEVISQVSDFSTSIASAVEEQGATTVEMTRASSEAARGGAEIVRGVAEVAHVATSTAEAARATQDAATQLSALAADLRRHVDRFRA
ncbi:methyl-accepting chemotaxis protein [Kineococcus sp. SYSU DK018]|uniref:methyl-accepting chemotaxis protein n=1 Tax=Kineococcus sp. SYSU DK018 TaxID=3383139 RepID=UPI003D7D1C55